MEDLKLWFDFLKTFAPAVVLPIAILWITTWQNRRMKKLEQEFDIKKITKSKEADVSFALDREKKEYEKIVHASLIKILFEVQKLHISLSGNCVDFQCLNEASIDFKEAFSKYQAIISDNQIYLSSGATNKLYSFYKELGQLMIEIKNLQDSKNYDVAIVCVYEYSQRLADIIIEIQEEFIKNRQDLTADFKKVELTEFRNCCGRPPSKQLLDKRNELMNKRVEEPLSQTMEV